MGLDLKELHWAVEADEIGITSLKPLFSSEGPVVNDNPFGVRDWLECYLRGEEPDFTPPLHLIGTPFQLRVWELLQQIPYGETTTYGKIASLFYSSNLLDPSSNANAITATAQRGTRGFSRRSATEVELTWNLELGAKKMSAQAVGQAVGRNPVALIVPCHRVVGAGGKLTGYAYGLELKKALLELEKNG